MFFTTVQPLSTLEGKIIPEGISLRSLFSINQFIDSTNPIISTHHGNIDIQNINSNTVKFCQNNRALFVKRNNQYYPIVLGCRKSNISKLNRPGYNLLFENVCKSDNFIYDLDNGLHNITISRLWGGNRVQIIQDLAKLLANDILTTNTRKLQAKWNWQSFATKEDFDLWQYCDQTQTFFLDCNLWDIIIKMLASYHASILNNQYSVKSLVQSFIFHAIPEKCNQLFVFKNQNLRTNQCSIKDLLRIQQDMKILQQTFGQNGALYHPKNYSHVFAYTSQSNPIIPKLSHLDWDVCRTDCDLAYRETQMVLNQTFKI